MVFKGYVGGVPESVISGGQYDRLMEKMKHTSCAVGFAVYLDLLEGLAAPDADYDADVLLLYDESNPVAEVLAAAQKLADEGKTVCTRKKIPAKLRYRELVSLVKGGADNG